MTAFLAFGCLSSTPTSTSDGTGGAPGTGGSAPAGTGGHGTGGATGTGGGQGGVTGGGGQIGSMGGRGGGGGAAGVGGAGGAGAGGAPAGSCIDGKQNGTETGVDCGGTCTACPTYKINPPNLKNNATSGCGNGGTGFMCTRSMVFSPEFKQAAMDDWSSGDPPFVYGTVGHDLDAGGVDGSYQNTCCQCYQLVFTSPRDNVTGLPTPKPMIVQTFNTAAGGGKNFDIYMAKGGEGSNTAGCTALYSTFPSVGEPNNGGIRPLNFATQCASMNKFTAATVGAAMCQDQLSAQCMMIQSTTPVVQNDSQTSCIESNQPENLYHLNWNVSVKRVECPANLTRVTGCKLNSQGLPQADPAAKDAATATSGFMSGYTTTTMQDCCRPTCAYSANVMRSGAAVDSSYGAFYTCDKSGNPS